MGQQEFTTSGQFNPITGITTYNFVVIGAGGGFSGDVFGAGGNGAIITTTYVDITQPLTILIGGGGVGGNGNGGVGGGLTQVFSAKAIIIAGGGGRSYGLLSYNWTKTYFRHYTNNHPGPLFSKIL